MFGFNAVIEGVRLAKTRLCEIHQYGVVHETDYKEHDYELGGEVVYAVPKLQLKDVEADIVPEERVGHAEVGRIYQLQYLKPKTGYHTCGKQGAEYNGKQRRHAVYPLYGRRVFKLKLVLLKKALFNGHKGCKGNQR